jgi:hypothetical protein
MRKPSRTTLIDLAILAIIVASFLTTELMQSTPPTMSRDGLRPAFSGSAYFVLWWFAFWITALLALFRTR